MTFSATEGRPRAITLSSLVCAVISVIFAGINTARGLPNMVGLDLIMATVFIVNYLHFRRSGNLILAGIVGLSMPMAFAVLATTTLGIAGLIWVYAVPIPTFYLLGTRHGLRFLAFWGIIAGTVVFSSEIAGLHSLSIKLELGICYALVCAMAYKVEHLRARNDEQIQNLASKAQQASRAKDHFLAHMSHELRTPLNAILGFSQVLQHRPDIPADAETYVEGISSSGAQLLELVESILDFSRLEAGHTARRADSFPLTELLHEAADGVKARLAAKDVTIAVDVDDSLVICADRGLLRQALMNLLIGAIKTTVGGDQLTLRGHLDDMLSLTVCYAGGEIGCQQCDGHCQQLAESKNTLGAVSGSCGLGLAIVNLIAEAHDGQLVIADQPGYRAHFTMTLPGSLVSVVETKPELVGA